ncbi:MAG: hypothetical protein H6658_18640 [Ardenticatenaceae bacterium]|nr:hypothetical protein [Ardenticatenaceae bacterium]
MLDAYQSLGTMPIAVKQLKVDFWWGTLKYLLGSSVGYFVCPQNCCQLNPTITGWFCPGQYLCDG